MTRKIIASDSKARKPKTSGADASRKPETPLPGRPVRGSRTGRPQMAALDLLGRRWALRILWELRDGDALTFRDLQARCGGLSSSVLNDRLRELREAGVVTAEPSGYGLSRDGAELLEALAPLNDWARRWARRMARAGR